LGAKELQLNFFFLATANSSSVRPNRKGGLRHLAASDQFGYSVTTGY